MEVGRSQAPLQLDEAMAHQLKPTAIVNWKWSQLVVAMRPRRQPCKATSGVIGAWLVCLFAAAGAPLADTIPTSSPVASAVPITVPYPGITDEAAMVLVGTALIGLGSAVRRVG
jgi:hypothetical protein